MDGQADKWIGAESTFVVSVPSNHQRSFPSPTSTNQPSAGSDVPCRNCAATVLLLFCSQNSQNSQTAPQR